MHTFEEVVGVCIFGEHYVFLVTIVKIGQQLSTYIL